MSSRRIAVLLLLCLPFAAPASAREICTLVADTDTGAVLIEDGDCARRVTPASTFKIALALMGYESGFLKDAHAPRLAYRKGDADWGGAAWKQPTDPRHWLEHSVVWYSQRITHALGSAAFERYVRRFDYGNADVSGDPGKANGLDRAWIASSLAISPREQVAFLRKLVTGSLDVGKPAIAATLDVVERRHLVDGSSVQGKTGMAYPRDARGRFDRAHPWGWYVGWGRIAGRSVVFARLIQEEARQPGSAGARARDALLEALPAQLAGR
ncbi:class D beta-lactamase [Ensifer soli]|uniref:class D beta-lactamase n=1 Tax=Ciceribacter sp. sgz301302 TaxID=3342379 RepID=UPI0035B9F44A